MSRRTNALRRARKRGAALVEAAIVLPTMVFFLGCTVFIHRAYAVKIDKQMGTRAGVMYYASHGCDGEVPKDMVPILDYADPMNIEGPSTQTADKFGPSAPAIRAGLKRGLNMVRAKPSDTVVSGSGVRDGRTQVLSRKVSARSEVACNEKAYGGSPASLVEFLAAFAKSGGGFLD